MSLREKFNKLASLYIKIPVAPIPTTIPLSSLLKSLKFVQWRHTWHIENMGLANITYMKIRCTFKNIIALTFICYKDMFINSSSDYCRM